VMRRTNVRSKDTAGDVESGDGKHKQRSSQSNCTIANCLIVSFIGLVIVLVFTTPPERFRISSTNANADEEVAVEEETVDVIDSEVKREIEKLKVAKATPKPTVKADPINENVKVDLTKKTSEERPMKLPDLSRGVRTGAYVKFITKRGNIVIKLLPLAAPKTAANFKKLVEDKYFNGCHFYRAEKGFVLQAGCWNVAGKVFPYKPLPLEYKLPNKQKFISMARTSNPNSATSEFSIMLGDNSRWLGPGGSDSYGYAVFAVVTEGWDLIMKTSLEETKPQGGIKVLQETLKIEDTVIVM